SFGLAERQHVLSLREQIGDAQGTQDFLIIDIVGLRCIGGAIAEVESPRAYGSSLRAVEVRDLEDNVELTEMLLGTIVSSSPANTANAGSSFKLVERNLTESNLIVLTERSPAIALGADPFAVDLRIDKDGSKTYLMHGQDV